jgi:hypothetical protein
MAKHVFRVQIIYPYICNEKTLFNSGAAVVKSKVYDTFGVTYLLMYVSHAPTLALEPPPNYICK